MVPGPVNLSEALAVRLRNWAAMEDYAVRAQAAGADIILFPEYGLTGPQFPTRKSALPMLL